MMTAYISERTNTPFDEAEQLTGIDAEILRKFVRDGILTGSAPYRVSGVVGWCDIHQARNIASRLNQARQAVEGHGISAIGASKKYGFSNPSIYSWFHKGWIRQAGTNEYGERLYNEGDIAFARAIADLTGHAPGKAVFPSRAK